MRSFRAILVKTEKLDPTLSSVISELNPLFNEIEKGEIMPPCEDRYHSLFQGDAVRYGFPHPIYGAAAEFHAALEDWRSKPWWPAG